MTKASLSQKSKGEDFTVPDLKLHHKATVAQSGTKTDVQTSGLEWRTQKQSHTATTPESKTCIILRDGA